MSRILILAAILALSCTSADDQMQDGHFKNDYMTSAVLWSTTSGEARALCYQAFRMARILFPRNVAQRKTNKKPAVVVDVDETVLDNSPYQTNMILSGLDFPAGWQEWTDSAAAVPLPGALEFLKFADQQGAAVFYVTNRSLSEGPGTLKNLQALGFPQAEPDHLLLKDTVSTKGPRRDRIEEEHEIVLLIGDNLNDFSDMFENKTVEGRKAAVDSLREFFGTRFIVLPNPMYGAWEGALYDYNWKMPESEKSEMRKKFLGSGAHRSDN